MMPSFKGKVIIIVVFQTSHVIKKIRDLCTEDDYGVQGEVQMLQEYY